MTQCAAFGCKNRPNKKIPGVTFHRFPKNIALRNKWLLAVRRVDFQPSKCSVLCSEHFSEDQIDRSSLANTRLRENAVPNIFKGYPKRLQKKLKRIPSTENEDEDCMSDEGLKDPEESISHSEDADQNNSSDILLTDKSCAYESSHDLNKNSISGHPNILRINPANVSNNAPKMISNRNLDPDLIDALSFCQVEMASVAPDSSDCDTPTNSTQSNISNELILQRKVYRLETMNRNYRKKIKMLQQQSRRQKAKIQALQNRVKNLEANQTTDEDISEDCISEDEIYEELLKHQMENNENSN